MKLKKLTVLTLLATLFFGVLPVPTATASAGLQVNDLNTVTVNQLIKELLEPGIEVSNVHFSGVQRSAGIFNGGTGIIGFESGIILSSGAIQNVIGPNVNDSISYTFSPAGDQDLNSLIPGYSTKDVTYLEFDFIPTSDHLSFQYVFASDEYNEYANSNYNDVFGFFVNGQNVALLPGTETPVSINNVNNGQLNNGVGAKNPSFYRDNDISNGGGSINIEMDGLTIVVSVNAAVYPGQVNHVKLAIADAGDQSYDSNVFIKSGSFDFTPAQYGNFKFSQSNYQVNENTGIATITVKRVNGSDGVVSVVYNAYNGSSSAADYSTVTDTLTFGDGETSKTFTVPITNDVSIEGNETVNLSLSNPIGGAQLISPSHAILTIVDNDQPGIILINGGSGLTTSSTVTVSIPAIDDASGVYYMMISNDPTFIGEEWQNYSSSVLWTLTPGDGSKKVYIKFKDEAGNISYVYSVGILLLGTGASAPGSGLNLIGFDGYYRSTPTRDVYGNSFYSPDNVANYPFEIYLPNELNPRGYRIHTNYTRNTDACASCHDTHTAAGTSLLQWYSVYDTCMACHDGTVSTTYNVVQGQIGAYGPPAFGGMFGTGAEADLSNHNVRGGLDIAAAPGGSTTTEQVDDYQRWSSPFGCESCHSPHGQGGNARILNPDPNFTARNNKKTVYLLTSTAVGYVAYLKDANGNTDATIDPYLMIQGYPYDTVVSDANNAGGISPDQYTIDAVQGYTVIKFDKGYTPAGAVSASFYPSVRVTMALSGYLTPNETVTHKSGMNAFCAACHTDYNTENINNAAANRSGTYSEAHRHQVGMDQSEKTGQLAAANMPLENGQVECLTCHVAHGTSRNYWQQTIGPNAVLTASKGYVSAENNLVEITGSSALKRVPNMGTCEACHSKGIANQGYEVNSGQTGLSNSATSGTANNPNYNDPVVYLGFTGQNANTLLNSVTSLAYYSAFLNADGTGFFKNEKYVGSIVCANCHQEYYEGWEEKGHSKSLEKVADVGWLADQFTTFAGKTITRQDQIEDENSPHYGQLGAAYTYDFTADGKMHYQVGTTDYYVQLSDISYVWMDHYILQTVDATRGIYKRVAVVAEDGDGVTKPKIKPYLSRSTAQPAAPTNVSWYQNSSGTGRAAEGCLSCHSPQNINVKLGAASGAAGVVPGTPDMTISCESCHGPGSRHAANPSTTNILNPQTRLNFAQRVNYCQTCHSGRHYAIDNTATVSDTVYGYAASEHYTTGLAGCTDCHDVHNTQKDRNGKRSNLQAPTEAQLCATCHDMVMSLEDMKGGTWYRQHGFIKQ